MYPYFLDDPYAYSTNYGLFGEAEILLNHIGIIGQLGINIFKPFYKVDRVLSQSYQQVANDPENRLVIIPVGKLDIEYELKRSISGRLGIRYFIIGTEKKPRNNIYISCAINFNFGQADFSEVSLGYIYNFKERSKSD